MKRFLFVLFFLSVIIMGHAQSNFTTFILVRHAEKASDGTNDPDLKPEGKLRAENLAGLFTKASIDAIYSTDFKRTRNTVAPLAAAKQLSVNLYTTMNAAELDKLMKLHPGGTIVIAGHSNTIPEIANALAGERKFEQFADDDYGNILVISVSSIEKKPKLLWLQY